MRMETKFLRLRTPVELGSLFGVWRVCWLGGSPWRLLRREKKCIMLQKAVEETSDVILYRYFRQNR
jgi:hypothetical protein